MATWHINPETGEPSKCSTTPDKCPYGKKFPGQKIYHLEAENKKEALTMAEEHNKVMAMLPKIAALTLNQRGTMARDCNTQEALEFLMDDPDTWVRRQLLKNNHSSGKIIEELWKRYKNNELGGDNFEGVEHLFASHPNSPSWVLEELNKNPRKTAYDITKVRIALAENENSTPELLDDLAKPEVANHVVHKMLASNPKTTPDTLLKIAEMQTVHGFRQISPAAHVRLAKNVNTPTKALELLVGFEDKDGSLEIQQYEMMKAAMENPNCSNEVLKLVLFSKNEKAAELVRNNPLTPMKYLLEDAARRAAEENSEEDE